MKFAIDRKFDQSYSRFQKINRNWKLPSTSILMQKWQNLTGLESIVHFSSVRKDNISVVVSESSAEVEIVLQCISYSLLYHEVSRGQAQALSLALYRLRLLKYQLCKRKLKRLKL